MIASALTEINVLQSEMLKFHKKLSPVKSQENDIGQLPHHEGDTKFCSSYIKIAYGFLKICVCILVPATFPAIIFCVEGGSQLFWLVTAVSIMISLLLALMTLTVLYAKAKKFKQGLENTLATVRDHFKMQESFRYIREVIASDVLKRNSHIISYLLVLVFASNLFSFISYSKNLTTVFYSSLVSTGFVCGILSSMIYNLLRSPELLPIYSPCKVAMHVTAPSPQVKETKRNLNLSYFKPRETGHEFRFSQPNNVCISEKGVEFTETRTLTANLPNLRSPAPQEITRTQSLQLPVDFRRLFRTLSF